MKLTLAAKAFLKEIEVRKYTPKTIRSYRNSLNLFLRYCAENGMEDTEKIATFVKLRRILFKQTVIAIDTELRKYIQQMNEDRK